MDSKTILLTGRSGLVGGAVESALRSAGFKVVSVISPRNSVFPHEDLVLDLADNFDHTVLPRSVDVVVHTAQANLSPSGSMDLRELFQVNSVSTLRLLNYAIDAGATKFLYFSTGGVYQSSSAPVREDSPLREPQDSDPYVASKLAAEAFAGAFSSRLQVSVFRPFFIYGRGQRRSRLLPRIRQRILDGQPIQLQSHDGIRINPVHVQDVVKVVCRAIEEDLPKILNLAGPDVLSLRDVATLIGKGLNVTPRFEVSDGGQSDLLADPTQMQAFLGRPSCRFVDALDEICADDFEK